MDLPAVMRRERRQRRVLLDRRGRRAGPGWDVALGWNVVPAGIGNMIGGALLVVLPFCYETRARSGSPPDDM